MGNCYHAHDTPNFLFPYERQLQGEYTTAATACVNAHAQASDLPSCLTSFTGIYSRALQIKPLHVCQGTQPPTLGLASVNQLLRHWTDTSQRAAYLWEDQAKLPLVSSFASSPVPYFLKTAPYLCSKHKCYNYAKLSSS